MKTRAGSMKTMVAAVVLGCAAIIGFASLAVASSPTIDGNNLTGFDSMQSVTVTNLQTGGSCPTAGSCSFGTGSLYLAQDASGNVYFAFVQPIGLNSNTYGTTSTGGLGGTDTTDPQFNWAKTHNLSDLQGSDDAEFKFYSAANSSTPVFDFTFDYVNANNTTCGDLKGSACPGNPGMNEGSVITGTASWLTQFATSMSFDALQPNFSTNYMTNSPTPTQDPGWQNLIIYEGEISAAAFGTSGFGQVQIPLVHDSPANNSSGFIKYQTCTSGCTSHVPSVPEPSSLISLGTGLLLLCGRGLMIRRRRSADRN